VIFAIAAIYARRLGPVKETPEDEQAGQLLQQE
jgi:hypothetical protein